MCTAPGHVLARWSLWTPFCPRICHCAALAVFRTMEGIGNESTFLSPSLHISAPFFLLFLNHDASHWRWALLQPVRKWANGDRLRCLCAHRIFGTRVTSLARVATAHSRSHTVVPLTHSTHVKHSLPAGRFLSSISARFQTKTQSMRDYECSMETIRTVSVSILYAPTYWC